MMNTESKIFIYITGQWSNGDVSAVALSEDGVVLAGHISSSEGYAKHDMGLTSTWKHELYKAAYPDGYELIWVTVDELKARSNAAFEAAYEKGQALSAAPEGDTA